MNSYVLLSSAVLLAVISCHIAAGEAELKIEVLHKPDECTETSKKGQLLHYKGTFEDGKQFDSR